MLQAMDMLSSSDLMKGMFENKDLVLQQLEQQGVVDAGEIEKFKKDPEYFEQKMKEGFDQMKDMFSNPDMIKAATETMKATTDLYNNPEKAQEVLGSMMGDFEISDEQIEEIRQMYLKDPNSNAMLQGMIGSGGKTADELQDILKDPKKWRDSVKEGLGQLKGAGAGAGMGEL